MSLQKNNYQNLKNIAVWSSVFLALMLCIIKAIGGFYSGSLAVLSSMVDSLSDIVASMVTFAAVKISGRPASHNYRYGYGKAEALSAILQAMFIAMSGLFILYDGAKRLLNSQILEHTDIGIMVMIISMVLTIILVIFQRYVARVTKSQAILADSAHYKVDIVTNLGIIASLIIVKMWHIYWIDPVIAIGVAIYLNYVAYSLGKEAMPLLLDRELSDDIRENVIDIVKNHPLKLDVHDLRTRDLGQEYLFEFHLELDGNLNLEEAHKYTSEVENMLLKVYPNAQIIIHQDPKGVNEDRLDNILV